MTKPSISKKEFFDADFYKGVIQDYEEIRHFRKNIKGKPDEYDRAKLALDKMFESFFIKIMD